MIELRSPRSALDWEAYHQVRRRVLFELRGRGEEYDPNHPDEHRPGNYPKILFEDQEAIGVIRIDLEPPDVIFRRVAVREEYQRRGYGTTLLRLAEEFARAHASGDIVSFVDVEAVAFYRKCGFVAAEVPAPPGTLPMRKRLK